MENVHGKKALILLHWKPVGQTNVMSRLVVAVAQNIVHAIAKTLVIHL